MKIERKANSLIRTEKEKLVMENFASVMGKLDATFLIENEVPNPHLEEKNARLAPKVEEFKTLLGDKFIPLEYDGSNNFSTKSALALDEIGKGSDKVYGVIGGHKGMITLLNVFTSPKNEELIRSKLANGGSRGSVNNEKGVEYFRMDF
jgi:hypothetical protein